MKNLKKQILLLVTMLLTASLLLAGCGDSKPAPAKQEAPKALSNKVKIALVLTSTVDDMAWAQSI